MERIGYYAVKEMTKEEKIAMYMKCPKKKLIEMLLENQRMVESLIPKDNANFYDIIQDINNKLLINK